MQKPNKKQRSAGKVAVAGADGYKKEEINYFDSIFVSTSPHDREFNQEVGKALKALDLEIQFITASEY